MVRQADIQVGDIYKLRTLDVSKHFLYRNKDCNGPSFSFIRIYEEFTVLEVIRVRYPDDKYAPMIHVHVMVHGRDCPVIGWLSWYLYTNAFDVWEKVSA